MGPEFEKGDGRLRAYNNASPAQRGPRRDAQPPHATPLAAVLFPARGATSYYLFSWEFGGHAITPCDSLSAQLTVP